MPVPNRTARTPFPPPPMSFSSRGAPRHNPPPHLPRRRQPHPPHPGQIRVTTAGSTIIPTPPTFFLSPSSLLRMPQPLLASTAPADRPGQLPVPPARIQPTPSRHSAPPRPLSPVTLPTHSSLHPPGSPSSPDWIRRLPVQRYLEQGSSHGGGGAAGGKPRLPHSGQVLPSPTYLLPRHHEFFPKIAAPPQARPASDPLISGAPHPPPPRDGVQYDTRVGAARWLHLRTTTAKSLG
ncbi:hypothetical protein VPH35_030828 [Triticum aestivum]